MDDEKLKAAVLAKCRGFGGYEKFDHWEVTRSWGDKWTIEHYSGDITYCIDANGLASSPVCPLAAKILGIEQPSEQRPSDALLWKAWEASKVHSGFGQGVIEESTPAFARFLSIRAADPLAKDRELVAKYMGHCSVASQTSLSIEVTTIFEALSLASSIKRLAGMEVGNG